MLTNIKITTDPEAEPEGIRSIEIEGVDITPWVNAINLNWQASKPFCTVTIVYNALVEIDGELLTDRLDLTAAGGES